MEFGVFLLTVKYFLQWLGKIVLGTVIILVCLTAIIPILPDDPLRSDILTISGTFEEWSDFLNWMVPTGFIVSSALFVANCKLFFFITKVVLNRLGSDFFQIFAANESDKY